MRINNFLLLLKKSFLFFFYISEKFKSIREFKKKLRPNKSWILKWSGSLVNAKFMSWSLSDWLATFVFVKHNVFELFSPTNFSTCLSFLFGWDLKNITHFSFILLRHKEVANFSFPSCRFFSTISCSLSI